MVEGEAKWSVSPTNEDKPCIVCRGRAIFAVAVPGDEEGQFWMADVCGTCATFHEIIAERIREESQDTLGLTAC